MTRIPLEEWCMYYKPPEPPSQNAESPIMAINKMAEEVAYKVKEWHSYLNMVKEQNARILARHHHAMQDYKNSWL